jgi:type IV pilus assembly protein PilW
MRIQESAMKFSTPRSGGFSIIELMVALTIGLIIVAAMLQNLSVASGTNRTNARVAEFQGNGRFATDFLRREIQHAGFAGLSWTHLTQLGTTATTDYGCGAGFAANITQSIWGANDTNDAFDFANCIPDANYARGDILVLRRADLDAIPTTATLSATNLYFRSEYLQGSVFLGPTRPASLQSPVADYLLHTDVYYISKWTNSSTESPQIPALYRMTLGSGPLMTKQLIASNVENMQVQYGVNTTAGTRFYNAGDVPASEWTSVVAVRLWLLARSTDAEPGYSNTSTYAMGDQTVTAADGYRRQVFPLVVQIRK